MLTGNGRHRRPRQAPALVVAAGVTGSAIAIPLLAAASAHATDSDTWDRLAACESGGSWSADTGNGYYGGLQLSQNMWVLYGGLDYAPRPDQASRAEQIAVAEKVLADRGPSAWPGCDLVVGLTQDGKSLVGDLLSPKPLAPPLGQASPSPATSSPSSPAPSASPSSDPSQQGDETDPSGTSGSTGASGSADGTVADGVPGDMPAPSSPPVAANGSGRDGKGDDGAATGPGRHRGGRADEEAASDRADDAAGPGGRHASRGEDGTSRGEEVYTVRPGDNLWDIARSHDTDGGWTALYAANKKTVGDDPDLILPGQTLHLS